MSFLIREVEGATAHVVEGRAEDAGTDLPAPREVVIAPGAVAYIKLLEYCTTDCDVEYMAVPRSSIAKTPLRWDAKFCDEAEWSTEGSVGVAVRNNSDAAYTIAAGDRLFQLITRDLRHMRVAPYLACRDLLCLRTERDECTLDAGPMRITAPNDIEIAPRATCRVDLGVAAVWLRYDVPLAFLMEIDDELGNIRLANNVGVIDAGYRGSLIAVFDNVSDEPVRIPKGTPLVRLTRPLVPVPDSRAFVGADDPLFAPGATARGAGAFGSTGAKST